MRQQSVSPGRPCYTHEVGHSKRLNVNDLVSVDCISGRFFSFISLCRRHNYPWPASRGRCPQGCSSANMHLPCWWHCQSVRSLWILAPPWSSFFFAHPHLRPKPSKGGHGRTSKGSHLCNTKSGTHSRACMDATFTTCLYHLATVCWTPTHPRHSMSTCLYQSATSIGGHWDHPARVVFVGVYN